MAEITYEGSTPGAGDSQRSGGLHLIDWKIEPIGTTPVSAAKIMVQGSPNNDGADNGAINTPGMAIGSTPEKFANALFYYRLGGTNYSRAAIVAGSVFSATHQIAVSKYGAINIYINAAGAISTAVPSSPQTYATALLAITAAEAMSVPNATVPAGNIKIGMIVIQNKASLWTANTDDLTNASDVTLAAFYSITSSFTQIDLHELSAGDLIAQKGTFDVPASVPSPWVRLFLSELTGEGNFVITDVLQK